MSVAMHRVRIKWHADANLELVTALKMVHLHY